MQIMPFWPRAIGASDHNLVLATWRNTGITHLKMAIFPKNSPLLISKCIIFCINTYIKSIAYLAFPAYAHY